MKTALWLNAMVRSAGGGIARVGSLAVLLSVLVSPPPERFAVFVSNEAVKETLTTTVMGG